GKTYVSCLILKELQESGFKALPFKPVCSGSPDDVERLREASGALLDLHEITPFYYQSPLAPLAASRIEGFEVDLAEIEAQAERLKAQCDFLLVEGAGGWEVPLAPGLAIPDLVRRLDLPILLVVDNKLGALNHTLLTVKAIKAAGLNCLGIILNHIEQERDLATVSNRGLLEELCDVPVLAEVITDADFIDWD
ncbi:MAG: dethiobiotin synthase, partial [Verrucomicrobiales bacterium]